MKLQQKRLNQIILMLLLVISTSLLGAYYLTTPEPPLVTNSSNPSVSPVKRHNDTVLMIQPALGSECKQVIQLTQSEILALPQQKFTTHHSWSDKADTFTGPSLEDVINLSCPGAKTINLAALNDYTIELDFSRAKSLKPIIAHSVNGARLSVREKGPLWVMVPTDDLKIPAKKLDGMLIWQLSNIIIVKTDDTSERS